MPDRPDVSIIIVNHHADRILGGCIGATVSGSSTLSREFIVVDNPSTGDMSSRYGDINVQRIPISERLGFAAACNLGVNSASGTHLLFLNPDVVVEPGAVDHLHSACKRLPDAGAVVGRLTLPDGTFHPSCRKFPTMKNLLFSHGSVLNRLLGGKTGAYMLPDYEDTTEVDWGAAALMMMRREAFEEVSGFDERYFMYLEDTDLCYRLRERGRRTYYVPAARGVHYWGYSTQRYPYARIVWHHRSIWRYFSMHRGSLLALVALAPVLAGNCLLSLLVELLTLRR